MAQRHVNSAMTTKRNTADCASFEKSLQRFINDGSLLPDKAKFIVRDYKHGVISGIEAITAQYLEKTNHRVEEAAISSSGGKYVQSNLSSRQGQVSEVPPSRCKKAPKAASSEETRLQQLIKLTGILIHTGKNWFGNGAINPRADLWKVDTRLPFLRGDGKELEPDQIEEFRDLLSQFFESYGDIIKFVKENDIE